MRKNQTKHQILCGKCGKPLGIGMVSTVIDTVEGVAAERKARYCDNPECGAGVYVIEHITESRFSWRRLFARRAAA